MMNGDFDVVCLTAVLLSVLLSQVCAGPPPPIAPIVLTNEPATNLPGSLLTSKVSVSQLNARFSAPQIIDVNLLAALYPTAATVDITMRNCTVVGASLILVGYNMTTSPSARPVIKASLVGLVLTDSTLVIKGYFPPLSAVSVAGATITKSTSLDVGQAGLGVSLIGIGFQQLTLDGAVLTLTNSTITVTGGSVMATSVLFFFGTSVLNGGNFTIGDSQMSTTGSTSHAVFCDPYRLPIVRHRSVVLFSRNRFSSVLELVMFETNGPSILVSNWSVFSFEGNNFAGSSSTGGCISMTQKAGGTQNPSVSGISSYSALAFVSNTLTCGSGIPISFNGMTPVISVNSSYIMILRNSMTSSDNHAVDSTSAATGQFTGGSVMTMSFNVYSGSMNQLLGGSMLSAEEFTGSISNYTFFMGCEKKPPITYCCTIDNVSTLMGPSKSAVNAVPLCSTCNVTAVCFKPNAMSATMNANGTCTCTCITGTHPQCLLSWAIEQPPTLSHSASSSRDMATISASLSAGRGTQSRSDSPLRSISASTDPTGSKTISPLITHFPNTLSPVPSLTHSKSLRVTRFPKTQSPAKSRTYGTLSPTRRSPTATRSASPSAEMMSGSTSSSQTAQTDTRNFTETRNESATKRRHSQSSDQSSTFETASMSSSLSLTPTQTLSKVTVSPSSTALPLCRQVVAVRSDNSTPITPFVNATLRGALGEVVYAFECSSAPVPTQNSDSSSSNASYVNYASAIQVLLTTPLSDPSSNNNLFASSAANVAVTNASNGLAVSWAPSSSSSTTNASRSSLAMLVFNVSFPTKYDPAGYFVEIRIIPDVAPHCTLDKRATALVFLSCAAGSPPKTTPAIAAVSATATRVVSITSVVSGSPTTASSQARTSMLLQLVNCTFQLTSGGTSITGLTLGDEDGQVVRGAVVGNLLLFVAGELFFELGALVVAAVFFRRQSAERDFRSFLQRVRHAFHVPSVVNVFACIALQPTVSAALILMFTLGDTLDVILGVVGLVVTALYVGYIWYHLMRQFHGVLDEDVREEYFASNMVLDEDIKEDTEGAKNSSSTTAGVRQQRRSPMLERMLFLCQPQGTWRDAASMPPPPPAQCGFDDDPLVDHLTLKNSPSNGAPKAPATTEWLLTYICFFKDFRHGWYHVADTLLNVAFGVVQGIIVERKAFCISQLFAVTILFLVQLWILIKYKPMLSSLNEKYMLLTTILGLACSVMILIGLLAGSDTWIDGSNYLTLLNSLLGGIKSLVDMFLLLLELQLVVADVNRLVNAKRKEVDVVTSEPVLSAPVEMPVLLPPMPAAESPNSGSLDDLVAALPEPTPEPKVVTPSPTREFEEDFGGETMPYGTALLSADESMLLGIRLGRAAAPPTRRLPAGPAREEDDWSSLL